MESQKKFEKTPLFVAKGVLLVISFMAGILGAIFCIWKDNHYGTTSFLLLEMVTALLLQLNVRHMKGQLFEHYNRSRLKFLLIFGCSMFVVSFIFTVFLLVMGIKYETEFNFIYNNSYFAFIPCLVSNFWYILLVYEIRNFMKMYDEMHGAPNNVI
ncbi:uncharacterized protein LOC129972585 [Argiope bruennichi]|uniref:uncharacterized protein LOC129972585 n=1 Tax=Argiope bruennichi TaxID=94029 RepID=UPI002494C2B0|nr:uncharacterized protein LOC129972585 [Argiope bruennichi]